MIGNLTHCILNTLTHNTHIYNRYRLIGDLF